MAARLGGGAFAQAVAALCAMTAPIYLALFTILSMNAFDVLFWSLAFWMVTKLLLGGDQRMWLLFGLITGIGLQNKTSMVFLGAGLVVVSAHRGPPRCVSDPLVLAGWLAREPVVRPVSLVAGHGWPLIEFMANARRDKNVAFSPLQFLAAQALETAGPIVWTVAMCGLAGCSSAAMRHASEPGLGYIRSSSPSWSRLVERSLIILRPHTVLLAAGGVALGSWTSRWPPARVVVILVIVIAGAIVAPLAAAPTRGDLCALRLRWARNCPPTSGTSSEGRSSSPTCTAGPSWRLRSAQPRYRSLPPEDRSRACVFGRNYGEAGAIDFFGARDGLPRAVSGHNSYYLWGPGDVRARS